MNNNPYQVVQTQISLNYVEGILHKYHKASEFLSQLGGLSNTIESYPTFIEELIRLEKLSENGIITNEVLNDVIINAFAKIDANNKADVLDVLNMSEWNQIELLCVETLAVIIYKYCTHDYQISFAKHSDDDLSDKGANDFDETFIQHAYSTLKDLKNLLLFKEEGFKHNNIIIDNTEERDIEQGKKKTYILKENQVLVNDPQVISKLVSILIEEKLQVLLTTPNEYINVLKFQPYTADTLTYKFVNEQFEEVKGMVEKTIKGKQPSKRAVFKGLISKLVKKYVKDEQFTIGQKQLDEREAQLIAYKFLSMFGFISLDLINSHKNRDSRIKYMDSLPEWKEEVILPNQMKVISFEEMIKNYSPS